MARLNQKKILSLNKKNHMLSIYNYNKFLKKYVNNFF